MVELVLQRAGAGGDDRLQAGQQRRDQVGEGLAGAGAGFGQQHVAPVEGIGDRRGQAQLCRARHERGDLSRQRPVDIERFAAGIGKQGHGAMAVRVAVAGGRMTTRLSVIALPRFSNA